MQENININEIKKLLPESMFYPCSADDGTPIKRCGTMLPLYIYVDYYLKKEEIRNTLRGYTLLIEKEISPEEFFGCSWDALVKKYSRYIEMLPFEFEDPYILAAKFVNNETSEILYCVNIKFEALATFQELYLKNNITPKGLAHIRCGIGFGGNYAFYVWELQRLLLRAGLPQYILCDKLCVPGMGDYLRILRKYKLVNRWKYYRLAYTEKGYDRLYSLRTNIIKYSMEDLIKFSNLPGKDNGRIFIDSRRRDKIIDILSDNPKVDLLHIYDYHLIYTTDIASEGDILLISCHIDHVFDENELVVKNR